MLKLFCTCVAFSSRIVMCLIIPDPSMSCISSYEGGSVRDKYGHEHSVNVQRWPIVYNQLKHDTMGGHVQTME